MKIKKLLLEPRLHVLSWILCLLNYSLKSWQAPGRSVMGQTSVLKMPCPVCLLCRKRSKYQMRYFFPPLSSYWAQWTQSTSICLALSSAIADAVCLSMSVSCSAMPGKYSSLGSTADTAVLCVKCTIPNWLESPWEQKRWGELLMVKSDSVPLSAAVRLLILLSAAVTAVCSCPGRSGMLLSWPVG